MVIKVLGISGSLRKQSFNRGLLQAAVELAPEGCSVEIFDLDTIPIYNQDLESPLPEAVALMKKKIREADALLIATPEYNYSFSGVLKNALDWGSRPYGESAWTAKKVAIMGASPSPQGTSRAQYQLRQVLFALNMQVLSRPELMLPLAHTLFDEEGQLIDEKARERVVKLLGNLSQDVF